MKAKTESKMLFKSYIWYDLILDVHNQVWTNVAEVTTSVFP